MKTHPISRPTVAAGLALLLALFSIAMAQPGPPVDRGPEGGRMTMSQDCQAMMERMKATDEKLLEQVDNLEGAATEARVDLLTDIVTTLVRERADMHARMRMMEPPISPEQMMNAERMRSIACMRCVPGDKPADATK